VNERSCAGNVRVCAELEAHILPANLRHFAHVDPDGEGRRLARDVRPAIGDGRVALDLPATLEIVAEIDLRRRLVHGGAPRARKRPELGHENAGEPRPLAIDQGAGGPRRPFAGSQLVASGGRKLQGGPSAPDQSCRSTRREEERSLSVADAEARISRTVMVAVS
jgi:hypothetical protein